MDLKFNEREFIYFYLSNVLQILSVSVEFRLWPYRRRCWYSEKGEIQPLSKHVVSKGRHCLSTTRSMSLNPSGQRQSCFYSSISICAQSSWPRKDHTPAMGTAFWPGSADVDDTHYSTMNNLKISHRLFVIYLFTCISGVDVHTDNLFRVKQSTSCVYPQSPWFGLLGAPPRITLCL